MKRLLGPNDEPNRSVTVDLGDGPVANGTKRVEPGLNEYYFGFRSDSINFQ